LRYLKQFELKLVAEVGKERAIVYENGAHVTSPERMLLPIYKEGSLGKYATSLGLFVYDIMAGVIKEEKRIMLSREETIEIEPLIKSDGLVAGGSYVEYRTDDARLVIEVIKEAVAHGVKAVNYVKVIELLYKDGKVIGAMVENMLDGCFYNLFAKKVINATGPWVDTIRQKDHSLNGKRLRLTKGVHVVMDQEIFPLKQAVYFDTPNGRMIFAVPRDGKTYVGTTDTFYDKDPVNPDITREDRLYLIQAINYMFPAVKVAEGDIESCWAGVRPLIYEEGKGPSEISRKDEIWVSNSGLVSIAGGKLTGYRKMAESVVDLLTKLLQKEEDRSFPVCQTKRLPISGGHFGGSEGFPSFIAEKEKEALAVGFSKEQYIKLVRRYGSNIDCIFEIAKRFDPNNSYGLSLEVYVQIVYGIEAEMTVKPVDFFIRRTGALYFDIEWVHNWKAPVIEFMANRSDWTETDKNLYMKELETQLQLAADNF
jgi:glycerol-3-phosphate dehydrogenase